MPYLTDTSALDEEENYLSREDLSKKIENLKKPSFFTSNSESIKKCMEIFLKNDQMNFNKIRAGRGFVFNTFYSVNLLLLLKNISVIKVVSDMRKGNAINIAFGAIAIGCVALSTLYIIDAVKNALKLIGHRNDEAKKQVLLANITENEREALLECFI